MKKTILIIVLIGVALTMSCQRNDVSDPLLFGPSTYDIILEGTAAPSSLYIPKERTPQTSLISVKVTRYDGKAVTGKDVVFQQMDANSNGIGRGTFDGTLLSVKKTTDASGFVSATYTVPVTDSVYPQTNETVYIVVTLVDDSRSDIIDRIPLKLYVYEI
jgi:hypothetical protein